MWARATSLGDVRPGSGIAAAAYGRSCLAYPTPLAYPSRARPVGMRPFEASRKRRAESVGTALAARAGEANRRHGICCLRATRFASRGARHRHGLDREQRKMAKTHRCSSARASARGGADAPAVGLIARFSGAWSRAWSRAAARLSPPPRLRAIAALGRAPRLRDGPAGCRDRSGTLPRVDVSALGGAKSLCP